MKVIVPRPAARKLFPWMAILNPMRFYAVMLLSSWLVSTPGELHAEELVVAESSAVLPLAAETQAAEPPAAVPQAAELPVVKPPFQEPPAVKLQGKEPIAESFQVKEDETQLARRFAVRELIESPFEYSLSAGYRTDNLRWSIAGRGTNIASEVEWTKTAIAQLRAAGRFNLGKNWLVRGIYSTGAVKSGRNRDSDYAGNDRTQEYSRSDNKSGGAVHDASIALGRKFRLFDLATEWEFYLVPLAGLSIHQQSLTMYDGHQSLPFNSEISGLQNSYDTQWRGSWFGLDALLGLGGNFIVNATVEYHRARYSADANWNLRSDLAHPISFKHVANGQGVLFSVGTSYRFSRSFLMNASFEQQKWNTYMGYDETNFSYGATNYFTLNPVSWDSASISLGAVYQF